MLPKDTKVKIVMHWEDEDGVKRPVAELDNIDLELVDKVLSELEYVRVVRCKDCKHYLRNKIYVIDGMPIMGNKVCKKWGGGCRTDENGFCYMGERREADGD